MERAAATDRRQRYEQRRREVARIRRSRRRRQILTAVLIWGTTAVSLPVVGWLIAGAPGAAAGGGAVGVLALGVVWVRWLAARRGAVAWDWQLQRHRLLGQASEPEEGGPDPQRGTAARTDLERFWD